MSAAATSSGVGAGVSRPRPPMTTGALAAYLHADVVGSPDIQITHVDKLEAAGAGALTFLRSGKFFDLWRKSAASAALVTRGLTPPDDTSGKTILLVDDADLALNLVLELFVTPMAAPAPGVHALAMIDPSAQIGRGVSIGPFCHVREGASVGDGTTLISGVYVGPQAKVGRQCVLHPHVSILDRCTVGDGCILHAGVVIGADGFGFRPSPDGRGVIKIPHIGNVVIEQGVEIGANSCVDRAKFGSTIVGAGSKLDNLVQIGHGVKLGRACLIAAQVGVGGSAVVGDGVMMGGQVGVKDQVVIGPMARIGGGAGVIGDVDANETLGGFPARDMKDWMRETIVLTKLAKRGAEGRPSRHKKK